MDENTEIIETPAQPPPVIQIPPEFLIDTLANEVANLNNQRIQLQAQVTWLAGMVQALQAQLNNNVPHVHEDGTEHTH